MVRVSILHPSFTWHTVPSVEAQRNRVSGSTPSTQPKLRWLLPYFVRRVLGYIHRSWLLDLSIRYCAWYGVRCNGQIFQLPFGLILKWSDGTRLEEVQAMRAARDAGLPVPRVISYGEHPDSPHAPLSILMTRMPGEPLFDQLWRWFSPEARQTTIDQLKLFFATIRSWERRALDATPATTISSICGTAIRSVRVPGKLIGPCRDEKEFNDTLIKPALDHLQHLDFDKEYIDELLPQAKKMSTLSHSINFTHGDFAPHNILVLDDGRISALLDWEAAGWYPEYWEYTTAYKIFTKRTWWSEIVDQVSEGRYKEERDGDRSRWCLTIDWMCW